MKTEELFERAPVWKSIFKCACPSVVIMFCQTVYNMADMVFVGQTGIAAQVAAVSARVAVLLLQMTLGTWIEEAAARSSPPHSAQKRRKSQSCRRGMHTF